MNGAVVEIIEDHSPGYIKPDRVLVNGTDVGTIALDGIHINVPLEKSSCVTVTLTLMVDRVLIRRGV